MPQGTKLGVILFTVMTNKLLSDWRLRIKYVDDTSALEIIPGNSPSLLSVIASDIHNFAIAHNMRLNPTKCKEMYINFLRNSNCLINSIIIGGNVIKRVNTYEILGVIMDNDLKWISHQFGSMPVLEELKTMVYVTNHNMITMAMVIFKTYKMADKGEERVLTEILVYSCFIEPFICLLLTMNWEVP